MSDLSFRPADLPRVSPVRLIDGHFAKGDHRWCGCDEHNPTHHYRAKIELHGGPLDLRRVQLRWRRRKFEPRLFLGRYEFDLSALVVAGLARTEHHGTRFVALLVHEIPTGRLVVRLNEGAPSLVLGHLA